MAKEGSRGGPRAGAGRKPKPKIPLSADKGIATRVLASPSIKDGWPGEEKRWLELLNAKDERLRFDVQKYLTDRRDGKPAQGVFLGDTREGAQALTRGNDAPSYFGSAAHSARKPSGSDLPN